MEAGSTEQPVSESVIDPAKKVAKMQLEFFLVLFLSKAISAHPSYPDMISSLWRCPLPCMNIQGLRVLLPPGPQAELPKFSGRFEPSIIFLPFWHKEHSQEEKWSSVKHHLPHESFVSWAVLASVFPSTTFSSLHKDKSI